MKHATLARLILTLGLALVSAGPALGQRTLPYGRPNYGPGYRPSLSPYLNLLRGGNPAANYYLGVRPEIQRRQNAQLFSGEIRQLQTDILTPRPAAQEAGIFTPLRGTGHPAVFGNVGTYFGSPSPQAIRPPLPRPTGPRLRR